MTIFSGDNSALQFAYSCALLGSSLLVGRPWTGLVYVEIQPSAAQYSVRFGLDIASQDGRCEVLLHGRLLALIGQRLCAP